MPNQFQFIPALTMLGYQLAWYLCVYGASGGYPYLATLPMLIWGGFILWMHPQKKLLLKWTLYSTAIGIGLDIALLNGNFMSFPIKAQTHILCDFLTLLGINADSCVNQHQFSHIQLSPLWMISLWWAWGIALRNQLTWLLKKPYLSIILGGILGMMSHLAGGYIGAIEIGNQLYLVGLIDVYTSLGFVFGWAVYMGMMCWIYHVEQKKVWKILESTQP